jgi:uncharacterized protein YdaU (DUF1376 family)
MTGLPYLPLFVKDYLVDTVSLSLEESGAQLHLLMHAWIRKGVLPDNNRELASMCKVGPKRWASLRTALEPYWQIENGVWTNRRLSHELNFVLGSLEKRRVAGALGGRARANKVKRLAQASSDVCLDQAQAPTITYTHTPIPTNQPGKGSAAVAASTVAAPVGAARPPVGGTEEQAEDVLNRVALAAGLALTSDKRKTAHSILADWLIGWDGVDIEADLLSPIRHFLSTHEGHTHSLARFSPVILDRKARAIGKQAAPVQPASVDRSGECDLERGIRQRMNHEGGLYSYLIDRCCLKLDGAALNVICPDQKAVDSFRRIERLGGARLLQVARTVAGSDIAIVEFTAET